jgi:hypothetical protein
MLRMSSAQKLGLILQALGQVFQAKQRIGRKLCKFVTHHQLHYYYLNDTLRNSWKSQRLFVKNCNAT